MFFLNKLIYHLLFTGLIVTILPTFSYSQTRDVLQDSVYQSYINTLKSGTLMICLSDRAGIRAKLVKYNDSERLRKFDIKLKQEFTEIINAFGNYYTFGKVFFFYRSEINLLKKKKFHEMRWLDKTGIQVVSTTIDTGRYLIGEFSQMERSDSIITRDAKGKIINKEPKLSFSAFVFRNSNFAIIGKWYAMHVRAILRNRTKIIRIMNARIIRNFSEIENMNKPK